MAVPKYDEFMPYVIQALGDGKVHTAKAVAEFCANALNLSAEERQKLLPSGGQTVLANRVGWAKTYLKKAGLVVSPKRGEYVLTDAGKQAFAQGAEHVTLDYLKQFDSYNQFVSGTTDGGDALKTNQNMTAQSPQDMLDEAISQINASLADDLTAAVMNISSYHLEHLVTRLLIKMGYGPLQLNDNAVTKETGDEGIDGIITADKFGFDSIYIQAKQWKPESAVGRPGIQKFLGALVGQGASKGLFITTAKFTKGAIEYAHKQLTTKIVLVDGEQLANLMIEYNLGVSTVETYEVKRIDYDFFTEDE